MPLKKTYKKKFLKKTKTAANKKVYKKSNAKSSLFNNTVSNIMPFTYYTRLPYAGTISQSASVGGGAAQWRLNSIHDPNVAAGTGHQPRGHDQLQLLYQRYLVYGAMVEFNGRPTGDYVNTACIRMCVSATPLNGITLAPDNLETAMESRFAKLIPINSFGSAIRFKRYFHINRIWGASESQIQNEENYSSSFGTNPGKVAIVTLQMFTTSSDDAIPFEGTYRITYYVKLYSPVGLTRSV